MIVPAARGCAWCPGELPPGARSDTRFCSRRCRQAAFRLRRRSAVGVARARPGRRVVDAGVSDTSGRFAYADPPYIGRAQRWYHDEEVDHAALIAALQDSGYAGWALSAAADSLAEITPLCPPHRVCAWVKPIGASTRTFGLHNCWEALIVVGGRRRRPGVRDWLYAQPARGGGELPGRKPLAFCAWLFDCLGVQPGDELVDLFPGTGVVTRAWAELSLTTAAASDARSSTAAGPGDVSSGSGSRRRMAKVLGDASSGPNPGTALA